MAYPTILPPKENALFKRILKCYEQKSYKNGLKFAKQILSNPKLSDHGETLSMKGLTLSCMGKKDEAFDFVRRGLRNNLKSHVCWHAYGLLQRADRKYDEAIKCYRNALKWDKENLQTLRDLSLLQIQMRDIEGYRETRYQLLVLRPGQKVSWIGYAMAHHLARDYDMSLNVLEEFRKTQTVTKEHDYEHSELIGYQVMVMVEAGQSQEALDHLHKYSHHVVDKLFVQETRGELLLQLGERQQAMEIYSGLLKRNPENVAYYKGVQTASVDDSAEGHEEMFRSYIRDFPRALTPKLLLLNLLQGEKFRKEADVFLRHVLRKGVPPTFKNLRSLYANPDKVVMLEELVEGYVSSLYTHKLFHPDDQEEPEPPTSMLWSVFYLAQHHDHLHHFQQALSLIDQAIEHTMTLIELYIVKAKIYKHMGDMQGAVTCLDEAQSLDTADRYVNCKCTKYMLRAGMLTQAQEMAAKFTREGSCAMENLNEMQCMWFAIETASYYRNNHRYGEALKKCHEIDRHFTEIIEDQFDFHTYCMRKLTLRSYVELLRLEDTLRAHKFFLKIAKIAIEIYMHLHQNPLSDSDSIGFDFNEHLSAGDRKKLRNKQRKKEMQQAVFQQQQQKQQQQQSSKQKNTDTDVDIHKEEELVPDKLARPDNALEEAMNFLRPLQIFSPTCIHTQVLAFNLAFLRGKVLLMLQAVKRGYHIEASHPAMHMSIIKFVHLVSTELYSGVMIKLLQREVVVMFQGKSAQELNHEYLRDHCQDNLANLLAATRMHTYLNPGGEDESLEMLMDMMVLSEDVTNVKDCEEVYRSLMEGEFGECMSSIELFKHNFSQTFPHSTILNLVLINNSNNKEDTANNNNKEDTANNNNKDHITNNNNNDDITNNNNKDDTAKTNNNDDITNNNNKDDTANTNKDHITNKNSNDDITNNSNNKDDITNKNSNDDITNNSNNKDDITNNNDDTANNNNNDDTANTNNKDDTAITYSNDDTANTNNKDDTANTNNKDDTVNTNNNDDTANTNDKDDTANTNNNDDTTINSDTTNNANNITNNDDRIKHTQGTLLNGTSSP